MVSELWKVLLYPLSVIYSAAKHLHLYLPKQTVKNSQQAPNKSQ